jgi:hypothetical protein
VADDRLDPRLAERVVQAACAAQELSEALWAALHEQLERRRARPVAELSQRLAAVAEAVASLAGLQQDAPAATSSTPREHEPSVTPEPRAHEPPSTPARPRARAATVLVDELLAPEGLNVHAERGARRGTAEDLG